MAKKVLNKAREISDAKIQFVSLVDAAANKRKFLTVKAENGEPRFMNYGRILKADSETHYITGVVYEPLTEDTDGEFMTAEEIRKAAYWYAKNGDKVDVQHNFEPNENCTVVENWVAKCDFELNGQSVKEGTWLMTVEVIDDELWSKVEKGEITGFSMGGICTYNEEDVDLDNINKASDDEKQGFLAKMAEFLGIEPVQKGAVADKYAEYMLNGGFWDAFDALSSSLRSWDYRSESYVYETDEDKIAEALEEFGEIITALLTNTKSLTKAITPDGPVEKAGKKISGKNKDALQAIYDSLGSFIKELSDAEEDNSVSKSETINEAANKEDEKVTKSEAEQIVAKAVAAAIAKSTEPSDSQEQDAPGKEAPAETVEKSTQEITPELLEQMVADAVAKAQKPQEEQVTMAQLEEMVSKAVSEAVEPIAKASRLPSGLNSDGVVEKSETTHYLHGIL